MDDLDYLPEFTPPTSDDEGNFSDHIERKSIAIERPSNIEMTLADKLKLLDRKMKPVNPYRTWDKRQMAIHDRMQQTFKEAPPNIIEKAEAKKPPIERQLEKSEKQLAELLEVGDELITNINIDNEKREFLRKEEAIQRKCELEENLKNASIESAKHFDYIKNKWFDLESLTRASDLYEELEHQKKRIADLMETKDDMIEQCQREFDDMKQAYAAEQERQARDLRCLAERINGQIDLMKEAYKAHLSLLEDTIAEERQIVQINFDQKLNRLFDTMTDDRDTKAKIIQAKKDFYGKEVKRIREEQEEVTRIIRVQLEKDVELLQVQLENAKNEALITSEVLDYNDQVLKKRNDEMGIISNQQKRRIAQLKESILNIKSALRTGEANRVDQTRKLSDDIQKIVTSIVDMERKALQFRKSSESTYHKVFAFNYREVTENLTRVTEVDRILYEQLLHVPWTMPDFSLEKVNAQACIPSSFPGFKIIKRKQKPAKKKAVKATFGESTEDIRFLKIILSRISDRCGYIIEGKLLKLLQPYSNTQNRLVRIENIFEALKLKDIGVVRTLTAAFKPYAWCPNCSDGLSEETLKQLFTTEKRIPNINSPASKTEEQSVHCDNHYLVLEPSLVLIALDDFIRQREDATKPVEDDKLRASASVLNSESGKKFWHTFNTFFPKQKEIVWKTMEHGLNHYLEVLRERVQLDKECETLRRQNAELKYLLQKFGA